MSWRRLLSVTLALVLVFNASTVGEASGKSFLRALTAPFRAFGKLFGGSRESNTKAKADKKVKRDAAADRRPAVADNTAQPLAAMPPTPSSAAAQHEVPATSETTPDAAAEVAATNLVTNSELDPTPAPVMESPSPLLANAAAEPSPIEFTPFIAGVARDSVAQGHALLARGLVDQAIAELSVAAATGLNLLEANNLLGLAYDRKGLHAQAREAYERVLALAPDDTQTLSNLGFSLYQDHQPEAAVKRLKQAARRAPADVQTAERLALVYGRLGKYNDAYKTLARSKGEFAAHLHIAAALQAANREREALKHLETARRLQPASPIVLERLVWLYERAGQLTAADIARHELAAINRDLSKKAVAETKP